MMKGRNYLPGEYIIRIDNQLDSSWSEWFESWVIQPLPHGETLLRGPVQDQAALFGVLHQLQRLGLPLIALNPVEGKLTAEIQYW